MKTSSLSKEPVSPPTEVKTWELRLYVAGQTTKSLTAFQNLKKNLRRTPGGALPH